MKSFAVVLFLASSMSLSCGRSTPANQGATRQKLSFDRLSFQTTPIAGETKFAAFSGDQTIVLEEPDDKVKPTVWDGPVKLINRATGATCQYDASLITEAYASPGVDYVIVITYSGSLRYVHFVNLLSCKEQWPSMEVFTEGILVSGDRLTIRPACECQGETVPCNCTAGKIFQLGALEPPALILSESRALTKEALGVQFEGQRKVLRPKTNRSELVEP